MMRPPLRPTLRPTLRQRGFTMVEAIVVIVITGIIGGIVAMFLRLPVQNYVDSAGRAELADIADTAVRRMARDIRLALPNSVRVRGSSIEFVPTKTGGRYLAAEDDVVGEHLNFEDATDVSFHIVGPPQAGVQQIAAGDIIVVNNLGPGFAPGDVYAAGGPNRAAVQAISGKLVTMASNPFAQQDPKLAHPLHRFLVVGQPVTYRCADGVLYRHSGYGFNADQVEKPSENAVLLASNVDGCVFSYTQVGQTRTALISLTLKLKRPTGSDGTVTLMQQIHVDNTP